MKRVSFAVLSILILSLISAAVPLAAFAASDSSGNGESGSASDHYTDVQGIWCEKWVGLYGYEEIFSSGYGCFHPDQAITRMEFARMLHRALDIKIHYEDFAAGNIGDYFDDVDSGSTGAGDLYDLVTCGIIDTKGSFGPSAPLDRDEMIHFIMNAFYHFTGNDYAMPDLALQPFADDLEIKTEYHADVNRSRILGLINGTGDNYVHPRGEATRAEAVTAAGRLAELLQEYKSNVAVRASANETDGGLYMSLAILNNTEGTVAINHLNGQKFDFVILDSAGNVLYRWSDGKSFSMMLETTKLAPGDEIAFSDMLDMETYSSIKGKIAAVKAYIVGTSSDFPISADGYFISDISYCSAD